MNGSDRLDNECSSYNDVKEYLLMLGFGRTALGKSATDRGSSGAGRWPRLVGSIHFSNSPPLSLLLLSHFFVFHLFRDTIGRLGNVENSKNIANNNFALIDHWHYFILATSCTYQIDFVKGTF